VRQTTCLPDGSRVRRESQARFCESLGLRFPGATHPSAMNVSQREGLGADGIIATDNRFEWYAHCSEQPFQLTFAKCRPSKNAKKADPYRCTEGETLSVSGPLGRPKITISAAFYR
jgi:hypothetical protein